MNREGGVLYRRFGSDSFTQWAHIAVDVFNRYAVIYDQVLYHLIKSFGVLKYHQRYFLVLPGTKYKVKG